MKLRWLLLLVLIAAFMILARPKETWTEVRRSWARRQWIVTMLLVLVIGYFLYGVYTMYTDDVIGRLQEMWR